MPTDPGLREALKAIVSHIESKENISWPKAVWVVRDALSEIEVELAANLRQEMEDKAGPAKSIDPEAAIQAVKDILNIDNPDET